MNPIAAAKPPSDWTETKTEHGRPVWTSPDGNARIQDAGAKTQQRFQVFHRKGDKWLEDIGWPSLKSAVEYVQGKKSLRDHPMHKLAGLEETAVIREEHGKYCVRSPNNPDWNGGCYDTKGEAEDRLKEVEFFKRQAAIDADPLHWATRYLSDASSNLSDAQGNMSRAMSAFSSGDPRSAQRYFSDAMKGLIRTQKDIRSGIHAVGRASTRGLEARILGRHLIAGLPRHVEGMRIDKVWVVRDPGPLSEMVDILFETTVEKLGNYVLGAGPRTWERENHAMYTEETEARKDAERRMARRDRTAAESPRRG